MPFTMLLTDSLTGERQPVPAGPVKLYVCGVTPYDTTHLGHAFTFVQYDALVRVLRWLGHPVTYIQNITDIDDSILQRAGKLGVDWRTLGNDQTDQYLVDMDGLNVQAPTHHVRATDAIPTIHTIMRTLLEQGAAYAAAGGSVFFRVRSVPTYGELSKLPRDQMLAIAAGQDDADLDDPRKEDSLDFALWKGWSGAPDEPHWDSPWGAGRPGWHIECSAMCLQYLGPQVTIHGGGSDLIFPHHESEIAQSEAATGQRPFARLWVHSAMVKMDGEKMSKSLGNMVFVRHLLRRFHPDAIRLYLLSHQLRQVFEWSEQSLEAAQSVAERLALAARQPDHDGMATEVFSAAVQDDFNTPRALEALEQASGEPLSRLASVLGLHLSAA